MKEIANFIKTTVLGGFFVVLPVAILILLMQQTMLMLDGLINPIAELLPFESVGGIEIEFLLAILVVLLICFVAGVVIRTRMGSSIHQWVESSILDRIPGYALLRNLTQRFSSTEQNRTVVLARIHSQDAWSFGFVADEVEGDRVAVFVPMAPTPTVGAVYLLPRENVREITAGTAATMNCLMQWGIGAKDLVKGTA